ncbi:hypothetical protein RF11_05497 [Thelohanellus kitauei]|uniref:Ig-like domain-containing protein n=1 Tax=Thelohanellus kitauei TaxID=669202 RepID=A0A0C2MSN6_THEKT|nr:hypothetical protein RF11_05497 [Thelohanellus kitauei]
MFIVIFDLRKGNDLYTQRFQRNTGTDDTFKCPTTAAPISGEIKWFFNQNEINLCKFDFNSAAKYTFVKVNFVDNFNITIKSINTADSGKYTCKYSSEGTNYEGSFVLKAKDFTSILWPILGILINGLLVAACIFISNIVSKKRLIKDE